MRRIPATPLVMDFILRPEIIAAITNTVGYPNRRVATDMVQDDIKSDPASIRRRRSARILLRQAAAPTTSDADRA